MPAVPDDIQSEWLASARVWWCTRVHRSLDGEPPARPVLVAVGLLALGILIQGRAFSQSPSGPGQSPPQTAAAQNSAGAGQTVPPVTTTVVVHGDIKDDYLPQTVTAGTLDGAPLSETPLSVTVVTRDLLTDQVARVLSDVVKNDASIGEDYAPVGDHGDFQIRGFPIDLATGLDINGITIAGEQDVPLENKERVEFLKGIAGVESGVASAGGLINYSTKRPVAIQAVDLATDQRGSAYGNVDLGRLFGADKKFGDEPRHRSWGLCSGDAFSHQDAHHRASRHFCPGQGIERAELGSGGCHTGDGETPRPCFHGALAGCNPC